MKFARIHRGCWLGLGTAMALFFWTPPLTAGGVVTSATFESLKAALVGGGSVSFAVDGTFTFTETLTISADTVISGDSHTITFSGNKAVRLFNVSTGAVLALRTLTLTAGAHKGTSGVAGAAGKEDTDGNGGNGGNGKPGTAGGSAGGGAIFNNGTVMMLACTVVTNLATGGSGGPGGGGGNGSALAGDGGNGGDGGDGGAATGGAIYNLGSLTLTNCYFSDNEATGGNGGLGGTNGTGGGASHDGHGGKGALAWGGAIYNAGTASVYSCTFAYNIATGGDSQKGGAVDNSTIGRGGPDGGEARGGSIHNDGIMSVVNSTLASSDANGGNGGDGGDGTAGTGSGGDGGNASGGVLCNNGMAAVTNATFADGSALPGIGGLEGSAPSSSGSAGSKGEKRGGNLANFGTLMLLNTIIANPFTHEGTVSMQNGHGSVTDLGHNLSSDGSINLKGPGSLKKTEPMFVTNANGTIVLTNNGGLTPTIALLPDSPAIDAGDSDISLSTDQRGASRPAGNGIDIGAIESGQSLLRISGRLTEGTNPVADFEVFLDSDSTLTDTNGVFTFTDLLPGTYTVAPLDFGVGFTPSELEVSVENSNVTNVNFSAGATQIESGGSNTSGQFFLTVTGLPERNYVIEASTNLTTWQPLGTNLTDVFGELEFTDVLTTNFPQRFFRTRPR